MTKSSTKNKLGKMQVSQPNNVKIYNLSAGKSLPEVRKGDDWHYVSLFSFEVEKVPGKGNTCLMFTTRGNV